MTKPLAERCDEPERGRALATHPAGKWDRGKSTRFFTGPYQSTGYAIVWFTDSSQKDFRWSDLRSALNLLVVGVLAAMLLLWFGAVHLLTSWCPNCRRFSMRLGGRTLSPAQDHSGDLLPVDYQHDVTFRYRCSRCGRGKTERHSGFWSRKG